METRASTSTSASASASAGADADAGADAGAGDECRRISSGQISRNDTDITPNCHAALTIAIIRFLSASAASLLFSSSFFLLSSAS